MRCQFDNCLHCIFQLLGIIRTVGIVVESVSDERHALAVARAKFEGDEMSVSRIEQLSHIPFSVNDPSFGHRVQFDEQHHRTRLIRERC